VYDVLKLNITLTQVELEYSTRIEEMMNVSQIVRELEFFCLQLEQEFFKIQEGLDVTSTGKLSAILVPPHNLSQILQQVTLKLPNDVLLLAGTNLENMFVYYEVSKVHAYTTSSEIRVIIRIPLRGSERVMNLYKTVPLPVYEPTLKRYMQITPDTVYMAVTESRQYYSLLTSADFQNCQQGMFTICDSEFPLYHKATPSYSGALYFGKHDLAHEHCDKVILREDFKPVWIHQKGIPNFWIYSLPAPIKVTKTYKVKGITNSIDVDLEGTGILYEEENCQIFSEDFLLLSTASGQTNFTLTRGQVVVPELPELLTPDKAKVVVDHHSEADGTLRALDTIVGWSLTEKAT
jgi:hypothetical protein